MENIARLERVGRRMEEKEVGENVYRKMDGGDRGCSKFREKDG